MASAAAGLGVTPTGGVHQPLHTATRLAILTMRYIVVMAVLESAGDLLRQARHRAGLTQTQLAGRAGVTQSVISAYESGRRQPSLPLLLSLVAATGHAVDASLVSADDERASAIESRSKAPLSGPLGRRVNRQGEEIKRLAAAYGADHVRVFGSVARGQDDVDSDVDLLLDLPKGMGLFTLGRLRRDLEGLLNARVDLVPSDGLKAEVRARVEADTVVL